MKNYLKFCIILLLLSYPLINNRCVDSERDNVVHKKDARFKGDIYGAPLSPSFYIDNIELPMAGVTKEKDLYETLGQPAGRWTYIESFNKTIGERNFTVNRIAEFYGNSRILPRKVTAENLLLVVFLNNTTVTGYSIKHMQKNADGDWSVGAHQTEGISKNERWPGSIADSERYWCQFSEESRKRYITVTQLFCNGK